MEFYNVNFAESVKKDFKKIPKLEVAKTLDAIYELAKNPRSSKTKKRKLEKLYRRRVDYYRVIYDTQDEVIEIILN